MVSIVMINEQALLGQRERMGGGSRVLDDLLT
jgi:hypothetical protein